MREKRFGLTLLGCWLTALAGCGESTEQRPVVPVSGQLFVQSKPAENALVVFQPQGELASGNWDCGFPRATVSADGSFRVGTYAAEDGAPEGPYKVLVTWEGMTASESGDPEGEGASGDRLKGRYSDPEKSTLEATVAGPQTELEKWDLK